MAKGKRKIKGGDSSAPPRPRSFRSRKRDCPSAALHQTDDVQATLHQQDTKENNTSVDATPLQHPQSPLQDCAMETNQQDEAAGQSCLTKQDDSREEKHAEETNMCLKNGTVKAFEGQEETDGIKSSNAPQLEDCKVHTDSHTNKSGMKEITPQEGFSSPPQTCTDQPQLSLPTSEESDGSYATASERHLDAQEKCHSERNRETSQEEPGNTCMTDVKEITKEAAPGLPAKKKRRMGMCGLTEKERSHFLQTQKTRENGQSGAGRAEKQICNNNTADLVAQEESTPSLSAASSPLSIPVDPITEQSKAEIKIESSPCGENDRSETEVHITVPNSDGTSTVCDPGCSEGTSCEVQGGTEPGPEQTGEPKSDPPTQDEAEEHLVTGEQRELGGSSAEIATQPTEKEREDGEDGSTKADLSAGIGSHSNPTQIEETEKKKDDGETLQVNREMGGSDEEMVVDASAGAESERTSSLVPRPGGFNCGSVEFSEAAATPTGSEKKDSCDPEEEPGPPPVNSKHTGTRDTTDPFGSGRSDYVSDSQLNTIVLIEEEVMEREKYPASADCREDATVLICGLIRELSSLNQRVMATHRELENLRRGSKTSRSSLR
ncbi:putative nucleolin 2-like [Scophthalmus maximus]|uniref:Putative nucleolin 2-like n=1 Tax=Scophthalmus maximus TaxID=52904 RepID=A0A2U9BPL1_SCOMX|nr:putative nucleolin 2-like [Scophthalmus maximus]